MSWVAVGVGTLTFASSMMGAADEQDAMLAKAKEFGVRTAGISFGADRRQSILASQVTAIAENAKIADMSVDKAQAQKEAMIRVQAALTGVGGDNVADQIDQTDVEAINAKYEIQQQKTGAINQKQIDFVDISLNADISKGYQDTTSRSATGKILSAGFSGLSAYVNAGGTFGGGGGGGELDFSRADGGDPWEVFGGGDKWNF